VQNVNDLNPTEHSIPERSVQRSNFLSCIPANALILFRRRPAVRLLEFPGVKIELRQLICLMESETYYIMSTGSKICLFVHPLPACSAKGGLLL
jgi:hypothetical protein